MGRIFFCYIDNTFSYVNRVAQFYPYCDNGDHAIYPSETEDYIYANTYNHINEDFIRINSAANFVDTDADGFDDRID